MPTLPARAPVVFTYMAFFQRASGVATAPGPGSATKNLCLPTFVLRAAAHTRLRSGVGLGDRASDAVSQDCGNFRVCLSFSRLTNPRSEPRGGGSGYRLGYSFLDTAGLFFFFFQPRISVPLSLRSGYRGVVIADRW